MGSLRPFISTYVRNTFSIRLDDGHTLEDALQPAYWTNVARDVSPMDQIEVTLADNTRWALLLVVDRGDTWATVKVLNNVDLTEEAQAAHGLRLADATSDYTVKNFGGHQKWGVERISDKKRLAIGLLTRAAAEQWLDDHKRALRN